VTLEERGNLERLALYDSDKVKFGGLAGELVLPDVKVDREKRPVTQMARTPFICGFTAGWTRFMGSIATPHHIFVPSMPYVSEPYSRRGAYPQTSVEP